MKAKLLILILVLITISACKKTAEIKNEGLIGKWKLIEVYNGYLNGGDFQWNRISDDNSHTLSFNSNLVIQKTEGVNGNLQTCVGIYSLLPGNNLEVNSSCNITTDKMFISELTPTSLIIDRSVIEGKIRYKYCSIK